MAQNTGREKASNTGWILAVAGAIGLGSIMQSFAGLVIGAVLGYLTGAVADLRTAIRALQGQVRERSASENLSGKQPTVVEPAQPSAEVPETSPRRDLEEAASPPASNETAQSAEPKPAAATTATPQASEPLQTKPAKPSQPREPSLFDRALAWLKAGNPLARVGIVVLFFGAAFLAKYSVEQGLVPVELRLTGLALGALVLVGLGWRLRHNRPGFSQLLQGGGIAGFYLTVFATLRVFELLPPGLAFALLLFAVVAAALLAVAQNALSLALIATTGGFLAPLLVSTGSGNFQLLFGYYAVLNLGVFAVAWFRAWRVLNLVAFAFTFGVFTLFRLTDYSPVDRFSADAFLLLFFCLFLGIAILFSWRQKPDLKGYVSGALVFGLPITVFSLHATLVSSIDNALAWSALAFGVLYAVVGWLLLRLRDGHFRLLAEAFVALAVIFGSLAIPLAFDARTTTAMWAVEGAGLLWLALRQQRLSAGLFAALLQLAAGAGLVLNLVFSSDADIGLAVLNSRWIGTLMLAAAGLFSGLQLHRYRDQLPDWLSWVGVVACAWGVGWWLLGGLLEIDQFVSSDIRFGVRLIFGALTAGGLHLLGRLLRWPLLDMAAGTVMVCTVLFGLDWSLWSGRPGLDLGRLGWLVVLLVIHVLLWRWELTRVQWYQRLAPWAHGAALWLLAVLLVFEGHWLLQQHLGMVWAQIWPGLVFAGVLWLANRSASIWPWQGPLGAHHDGYRVLASVPLAVAALLWVVWVNLIASGDPVHLPYLPLLNPLDIAVAVVLMTLVFYWRGLDQSEQQRAWPLKPRSLAAWVALSGFIWLTAALLRSLHHLWAVPWAADALAGSTLVQASLSVFWGLLGITATVFAARRGHRWIWIAGAGLLAVVVAKLFLIDLSGTNTPARIISFLSVGALLLLAGYLAPLPPAKNPREGDK